MYGTNITELTIENILSITDEYNIFRYYINRDFKIGKPINSPLRKDKNPSFCIFQSPFTKKKLMYKDFAKGDSGTCFDLVMSIYNINLIKALKIIDKDLNLGINNGKFEKPKRTFAAKEAVYKEKEYKPSVIEVMRRPWNSKEDKKFWYKYQITCKDLNYHNVYPLNYVWINDNIVATYNRHNPIYGYKFHKDDKIMWKIYQPYNKKYKWLSNTNKSVIQGWDQLPKNGDKLIITKSLKDVICLDKLGYAAIAPQAESQNMKDTVLDELRDRFKDIKVFFDNDFDKSENIGRLQAQKFCKINNLYKIEIPDNYKIKDISDFIYKMGVEEASKLIDKLLHEER